jgi:two-component system, sensor histidine kinase
VRGICRALGHPLTLTSLPQLTVGTEVALELPEGEAARAASEKAADSPAQPSALDGREVLIIDDELDIRTGMAALLESWHCRALCAGSLDEAAGLLAASPKLPDAVVCDWRLPQDVTGAVALAELEKRFGAKLPAVFVTGDTSPERLREMKATGHLLLFKPVPPGKLRAALSALLRRLE